MGRVATHIQGARGWLDRAAREWASGSRARAVLDLTLAEAEVRLARRLAASEPAPVTTRRPVLVLVGAAAVLAVALAGGLRWPASPISERAAAHAATAAVSLGYVPGRVLALVAPPEDRLVGRPWVSPSGDEATAWLRTVLREAGVDPDAVPAPVVFR